jgi:polyisoprenyl-phosphate glycosyltransferase
MYLSIVSPVYRASEIVEKLVREIHLSVKPITDDYEIILVEDGSPDDSWHKIEEICKVDRKVKGVKLSRNFGQHPAIMAGLAQTFGEWTVVMDCDLQDQPKEIIKLYQKAIEGYDVVMARRVERKDNFFKRMSSQWFSKIFNFLSDVQMDHEIANFGIYHRKVITSVLEIGDYIKSFPLFVYFVGFRTTSIPVEHLERESGSSTYTLKKLVDLAFDGIISYSNKPLRIFVKIGAIMSFFSFSIGIYYMILALLGKVQVLGYASIIISIFFSSGILISVIGIVGVYLGKVFEQTKRRPAFIIDKKINIS